MPPLPAPHKCLLHWPLGNAQLIKEVERAQQQQYDTSRGAPPSQHELPVSVRAQLAILSHQWPVAESLLLAQGKVDDAIAAYKDAHRWEDALRVADSNRHPSSDSLHAAYFKWLLAMGQEDRAGMVKEREGDLTAAIGLYLKGGMPACAAQVIIRPLR